LQAGGHRFDPGTLHSPQRAWPSRFRRCGAGLAARRCGPDMARTPRYSGGRSSCCPRGRASCSHRGEQSGGPGRSAKQPPQEGGPWSSRAQPRPPSRGRRYPPWLCPPRTPLAAASLRSSGGGPRLRKAPAAGGRPAQGQPRLQRSCRGDRSASCSLIAPPPCSRWWQHRTLVLIEVMPDTTEETPKGAR
jgi:hypothetical protein